MHAISQLQLNLLFRFDKYFMAATQPLVAHIRRHRLKYLVVGYAALTLTLALLAQEVLATTPSTGTAPATTGGSWAQALVTEMKGWLQGYVGTAIGLAGTVVGLIAGIAKQSLMGLGTGIGLAIAGFYGANMIDAIRTVTLA